MAVLAGPPDAVPPPEGAVMDGSQFDQLARALATGTSRRRVLKRLVGGAAAGALALVGARSEVDAAHGRPAGATCLVDLHCASGFCDPRNRRCVCPPGQTACGGGCIPACRPLDQCHAAGVCEPATGQCTNPPKPDGAPCDDGDACTRTDTCQAGVCEGTDPVLCTALDECHVAGTCNPSTGQCSNPNAADGTPCSDANACTSGDACHAGVCGGGSSPVCSTDNPCLEAYCDPSGGCQTGPKARGTACGDGDACTTGDACDGAGTCVPGAPIGCGMCLRCNATNGSCEPDPGQVGESCSPPGQPDRCFGGFACTASGVCQGVNPVVCAASDQCHVAGVGDPGTGLCSNPKKADGSACNDGNACTRTDTCRAGVCVGGNPVVCTAQGQCRVAGTCDPSTGTCSNPAAPDGTLCDDGDACTENNVCTDGACRGTPINCDDGNACTTDYCDSRFGCIHDPLSSIPVDECVMYGCVNGQWLLIPTSGNPCYYCFGGVDCGTCELCGEDGLTCEPCEHFGYACIEEEGQRFCG